MSVRVVLTGGGTAGHVNPNIALLEPLRARGCDISYVGSVDGVERAMMSALHIPYFAIRTGRLRRYFSWQNMIDPFNVLCGVWQAYRLMQRLKPQVVFSKGGFVALPVVLAAWLSRIPVVAHESDLTPGLANRLSLPFIQRLCVTFPETRVSVAHQHKVFVTGTPIRAGLLQGSVDRGRALCGFDATSPCLLVMGGSLGAQGINACIRQALPELTLHYQVIHLCGKGNVDNQLLQHARYRQFEYVEAELADLLAAAHKPHVLIPLPRASSRGDQCANAQYFATRGISEVLEQQDLTVATLLTAIQHTEALYSTRVAKMAALNIQSAITQVVDLILASVRS